MTHATTLLLASPEATEAVARRLAGAVRGGDVLLLEGPIGAGKTHFARALIGALHDAAGEPREDVPSPSYTLVQSYMAGALEVWHADLYRLGSTSELEELGLEAALGRALVLVEWPERLGRPPDQALTLRLAVPDPAASGLFPRPRDASGDVDDTRLLTLLPAGARGAELVEVALG
ncbi:MAG: tRNA (adenosine(37)-N6)-threonylcarbamoyltransferase complex ATPase subunit type 1 TsaE [Alkalilacustris sp.]